MDNSFVQAAVQTVVHDFGLYMRLLGVVDIQLEGFAALLAYGFIAYVFLYKKAKKRPKAGDKAKAVEYVVNGQGQVTTKRFLPSDYPGYSQISSDSQGRIFGDPTGKIVCTRLVKADGTETGGGLSRAHLIALCLVSVGLSAMFDQLWKLISIGSIF